MTPPEVTGAGESSTAVGESRQPIGLPLLTLFGFTLAAQLISLAFGRQDQSQDFAAIVGPSLIFLSALTLPLAALGLHLGRRIGLGAPLLVALLHRQPGAAGKLAADAALAGLAGLMVGALLLLLRAVTEPHLPAELPAFGHRGVLGGLSVSLGAAVAEEVWFRLGLMTLLAWGLARLSGQGSLEIRPLQPVVAWAAIVITSVGFGVAHLPQLMSYGTAAPFAIAGTIVGNTAVGILYGWCYWRRSLLAAMIAHFSVDLVLHVLPALL